jgi:hypothetical protein
MSKHRRLWLSSLVLPNLAWGGEGNVTLYITATTSAYTIKTKSRGFVPYA